LEEALDLSFDRLLTDDDECNALFSLNASALNNTRSYVLSYMG